MSVWTSGIIMEIYQLTTAGVDNDPEIRRYEVWMRYNPSTERRSATRGLITRLQMPKEKSLRQNAGGSKCS